MRTTHAQHVASHERERAHLLHLARTEGFTRDSRSRAVDYLHLAVSAQVRLDHLAGRPRIAWRMPELLAVAHATLALWVVTALAPWAAPAARAWVLWATVTVALAVAHRRQITRRDAAAEIGTYLTDQERRAMGWPHPQDRDSVQHLPRCSVLWPVRLAVWTVRGSADNATAGDATVWQRVVRAAMTAANALLLPALAMGYVVVLADPRRTWWAATIAGARRPSGGQVVDHSAVVCRKVTGGGRGRPVVQTWETLLSSDPTRRAAVLPLLRVVRTVLHGSPAGEVLRIETGTRGNRAMYMQGMPTLRSVDRGFGGWVRRLLGMTRLETSSPEGK